MNLTDIFSESMLNFDDYYLWELVDWKWVPTFSLNWCSKFHLNAKSIKYVLLYFSNPSRLSSSNRLTKIHSGTTDSGVCEVNSGMWSSKSSFGPGPSAASSQTSFSSVCLPIPKIGSSRKAISDSLLLNTQLNRARKVRLAMALLFLPSHDFKEMSVTSYNYY